MPCFLIDTGCKCRKKLVSITTIRLRRSTGIGWRKMLFQICDSRIVSPRLGIVVCVAACGDSAKGRRKNAHSHGDVTRAVLPIAFLFQEQLALVDFQLTVVREVNGVTLERPGRGALEVDPVFIKSAAMAGAFELLLRFQPVGRAAKVRADALEGDDLLHS